MEKEKEIKVWLKAIKNLSIGTLRGIHKDFNKDFNLTSCGYKFSIEKEIKKSAKDMPENDLTIKKVYVLGHPVGNLWDIFIGGERVASIYYCDNKLHIFMVGDICLLTYK